MLRQWLNLFLIIREYSTRRVLACSRNPDWVSCMSYFPNWVFMSSKGLPAIEQRVREWLDHFVVGLNLCPFARPVVASDGLRIRVCESVETEQIMHMFLSELDFIQSSSESDIATTLLVIPNALMEFDVYLAFIDLAEELLKESGLEGVIQLASFHPRYQFDGEPENSASHFSNRSPYPLVHFLREDMLARALGSFPNPETIPTKNINMLESIGREEIERRWAHLIGANPE
jgi:hypothetical protein